MAMTHLARKSQVLKRPFASYMTFLPFLAQYRSVSQHTSFCHVVGMPVAGGKCVHFGIGCKRCNLGHISWIHSGRNVEPVVQQRGNTDVVDDGPVKKRKKLKGKRAVVRWLKFFRWKKKKDYERMTAEEKILDKLRKVYTLY